MFINFYVNTAQTHSYMSWQFSYRECCQVQTVHLSFIISFQKSSCSWSYGENRPMCLMSPPPPTCRRSGHSSLCLRLVFPVKVWIQTVPIFNNEIISTLFFTQILGKLTIIYFKGVDAEQLNLFCSGAPLEVRLSQNKKTQHPWIFHQFIMILIGWGQPRLPGEPGRWPDHPPQGRKGPRISRSCRKGEWYNSTICPLPSGLGQGLLIGYFSSLFVWAPSFLP